MSDGNKTNNGVHEVGTEETRLAYQNDTPGQHVERYLNTINEVIEEKKEKQKKTFTKVFDNPLKGFPYNEELDDNLVNSIQEDDKRDGDPCWKGYKQVGMKKKGGKEVPNCVPMNEEELEKAGIKKEDVDYSHAEDLEEGKYAKYSDLLMKKAKEMQAIDKAQNKSGVASPSLNALKSINKEIEKEMKKLGITESINEDLEEGKMGELFLDIQNGATAKDIAKDYPVTLQQAKDFLKDYYGQKKKPLKMGEETEILKNYDSLLEAKDLMPDIKKIVDTKSATKVGGVMLDMFTASMILTVYDKVNDQNKSRMEKSNIQTLVHIAHKVMGVKEETVSEAMKIKDIFKKHKRELTKAYKTGDLSFSGSAGKKAEDDLTTWAMDNNEIKTDDPDEFFDWLSRDLEDIVKGKIREAKVECPECHGQDGGCDHCDGKGYHITEKFKPYADKVYSRCVDFYIQFRGGKGDRITSEENKKDFIKATDMIDAFCKKNKIKQKPVYSTPMEGSSAYKVGLMIDKSYSKTSDYDDGVDLQPLYVALSKLKTAEDHGGGWDKSTPSDSRRLKGAVIGEGKMDGGKLTGQEISIYFRRHKVRDKMTRKAVEYALDHGGAMKFAIKGIEKMKKGLSKDKDVQKALNYANFGESVRVNEVGFMFKEDSPIAGNMQVEGDPYVPQKKGVNKNIANYWKKEIKGISQKELEAVQSMYMITDHSGVIQMYKAGKRAFIKSIKESNGKLTRTTNEAKGSGNMYLEIQFRNRNEAYKAMDVIGGNQYQSRASEIENEKETIQFFDVDSKEILKMLKKERKLPKFKVVTDEKM